MASDRPRHGRQADAHWTVTRGGGNTVVTLSGEIDLAAVGGPTEGILGAIRSHIAGEAVVVFDLSGVTYIDSTGLHLLTRLKKTVESNEGRFAIVRPSEQVQQVLKLSGLDEHFGIES